jgi:hypothetical protein
MQLNILKLYLNDLVIFFTFFELSTFYMSWIIHFELIETTIQMLHITFTNMYWNTHNNLMFHIYIWMG